MVYLVPENSSTVSYFLVEKLIYLNEILMFDAIDNSLQ